MKKLLFSVSLIATLSATSALAGGGHDGYVTNTRPDDNYPAETRSNSVTRPQSSWYLTIAGVDNFLRDQDATIGASAGEADFDNGWGVLVAAGHQMDWGFLQGTRGELELGWRQNDVDSFTTAGVGSAGSGDINTYSLMANAYYDMVNDSSVTPYLGLGIGGASISANDVAAAGVAGSLDDNDVVFAYQGIAGVNFALNQNWSIQTEYRYFATTEADFTSSTGASADMEYDSHNLVVGLKYSFY